MKYSIIIAFLCILQVQPVSAQNYFPKILVSYNGLTQFGRNNRDSAEGALNRLGVTFDTLDRNLAVSDTIDYTPYGTLIWASGDPTIAVVPGEPTGQAGLSAKEINEVEQFLNAGEPDCKKSLIIAGQNIAYEHGFVMPNGISIDTEFLQSWLHVKYVANSPDTGTYSGTILGQQPIFWKYPEKLISSSPDVVLTAQKTPLVGSVVNEISYSYSPHPATPNDSGACVTYYNNLVNTTFFAFDWADPMQVAPRDSIEDGLTSGITRILSGALAFVVSHGYGCTSEVMPAEPQPRSLKIRSYPNPFSESTEIIFTTETGGFATVSVLNFLGIEVAKLFCGELDAGEHSFILSNISDFPDGVYECMIRMNGQAVKLPLVLIR